MNALPDDGAQDGLASFFPTEITSSGYRRRKRVRRAVTAAVVAVLVAGGGLAVAQSTGSAPPSYRLATAGSQTVTSTIDGVATIQPVAQADVAFPNDGTVATVDVAVGDTVAAGETLAQLDTDALMTTVRSKEADLDQAELILAKALDGEDVSSLVGGFAGQSYRLSSTAIATLLAAVPAADAPDGLSSARSAVASAQHDVDAAIDAAAAALSSATSVCSAIGVDATASDAASLSSAVDACQSALNTVVAEQNAVNNAQAALADASSTLDGLLQQWADDASSDTTTPAATAPATTEPTTTEPATTEPTGDTTEPTTATTAPTGDGAAASSMPTSSTTAGATRSGSSGTAPSGGGSASGGTGGGSSTSSSPTASDIASYQQDVDAAQSALDVADLAVAQATISSPIDGTVVALNIAAGDDVTAGDSTATIVIQGTGGYEATTTVSLADVADVHVGATATVLPDGSSSTFSGTVTSVAEVPSTSSGSTSFTVAIALAGDTSGLHNGGIGSASIVTGASTATLAVPTSAVTTNGTQHTVDVDDGTTVNTTRVEVGVVGPVWTEIRSGLTAGQQVVLADLDAALPSSATSSSNSTSTNGGFSFPGGAPR